MTIDNAIRQTKDDGPIIRDFDADRLTEEQKDLCRWLYFILEENLPLTIVRKRNFRYQSKYKVKSSYKLMKDIVHKLTE